MEVQTPAGDVGRTERLSVHVGQWPSTWIDEEKRERALEEMRVARERGWIDDPSSWAEEVEEAVDPASVLETRGRLRGGLRSGRFRVTGTVYFQPLGSFDPKPEVPAVDDASAAIGGTSVCGSEEPEVYQLYVRFSL